MVRYTFTHEEMKSRITSEYLLDHFILPLDINEILSVNFFYYISYIKVKGGFNIYDINRNKKVFVYKGLCIEYYKEVIEDLNCYVKIYLCDKINPNICVRSNNCFEQIFDIDCKMVESFYFIHQLNYSSRERSEYHKCSYYEWFVCEKAKEIVISELKDLFKYTNNRLEQIKKYNEYMIKVSKDNAKIEKCGIIRNAIRSRTLST